MIGNLVSNLKSRLGSARVADSNSSSDSMHSFAYSTADSKSPSLLNKLLNASYALVSQHQDDAYCNENLFMLPRVYSHSNNIIDGGDSIELCRSPISLQAPEKSLDELDNIVDKFVRCISIETGGSNGTSYDGNVSYNTRDSEKRVFTLNWLMDLSFCLQRKNDREAIRRRLAMGEEDDYLAVTQQRPIRKPNLQSRLQNGKPASNFTHLLLIHLIHFTRSIIQVKTYKSALWMRRHLIAKVPTVRHARNSRRAWVDAKTCSDRAVLWAIEPRH